MQDKLINLDVLCILTKKEYSADLEVDYVDIENPFTEALNIFSIICDDPNSNAETLEQFINDHDEFDKIDDYYRYCENIKGTYQGFGFNKNDILKGMVNQVDLISTNKKSNPENYDTVKEINDMKATIKKRYILGCHAFAIKKTYGECRENKNILIFSHRDCGWSNPVYQLTPDFSVEIKTNFGYGQASYFYTKLKYKNIEIFPISEWVTYEFAKFSEIVRYTRKHYLEHKQWLVAMTFAKDACNTAVKDENKFISTYILDECEIMVKGLEDFFLNDNFSFYDINKTRYTVDKRGHVLVEFRGEKISGAIDFISKIAELEKIAAIDSYIQRIRDCNKRIQPILAKEIIVLNEKIKVGEADRKSQQPEYDRVLEKLKDYALKQDRLKRELVSADKMTWKNIDIELLSKEFDIKYPEYSEFLNHFKKIKDNYIKTTEHLNNLISICHKIDFYNTRIIDYFQKNP